MSKSERSWSVQIRELFGNNKVSLGISTLSLTIAITVLAVTRFKQPPAHAYTVNKAPGKPLTFEPTCLDCRLLFIESQHGFLSESVLKKLHITIKDGHRQCCFNNTDQIDVFIEVAMKNYIRETTVNTHKIFPTQIVATHKNLLPAVNKDVKYTGEHIYLTYDVIQHPNEYTHGVTVTQDSLIIKFTGQYYIYCSIRFHQVEEFSETTKFITYVHQVSPYNPGGTGVLLKSVHSAVHKTTESSFTGGIFLLQEGDRIQVCVTNEVIVDFKSESTFTGIFLLTSNPA